MSAHQDSAVFALETVALNMREGNAVCEPRTVEDALNGMRTLRSQRDELLEALEKLRLEAAMLLQHCEGCAQNHYGHDLELYGMPQWLVDSRANIEAVNPLIARAKS